MTANKTRLQLLDERREALDKMQSIIGKAEQENRNLTTEEKRNFESENARFTYLDAAYKIRSGESINASNSTTGPVGKITYVNRENGNENLFFRAAKAAYAPQSVQHRAITTTSGAGSIDTDQISSTWIPFTHNTSVTGALGINVEADNAPNRKWPKVTGAAAVQWPSEGSDLNEETSMTIGAIERTDYTVAVGPLKVSVQAFQDSDVLEQMVNNEIAAALESEVMRVVFHGSGSGQPAGLDKITGVNYLSVDSNLQSATPPYGPFADAWKKCAFDNFNSANVSVAYSTEVAAQMMKLYATDDQPLLLPSQMEAWNWVHTNSITNNGAYLGDFSKMRLWFRSFNIKLVERYADSLHVGFIAYARVAVNVDYPGHFCRIDQVSEVAPTT